MKSVIPSTSYPYSIPQLGREEKGKVTMCKEEARAQECQRGGVKLSLEQLALGATNPIPRDLAHSQETQLNLEIPIRTIS